MPDITACTMDCPDACSLIVDRDRNGVLRIRGNPEHPFTRGFTCAKIKRHPERLAHPARLLSPRLRTGRGWTSISWNDALDLCAEKLQALRLEPESILHIPGAGAHGLLKQGVGFFFSLLGSSRVTGSLCDGAGYSAYLRDFGSRKNPHPEDILNAHRIVNWGKDLSRSSIHLEALVRQARQNGTRVLTISPGGDGNGPLSDTLIRIRPGTDRFLAAAALREFPDCKSGRDFAEGGAKNWPQFLEMVRSWSVPDLLSRCGVSADDLVEIIKWYSGPEPCATIVGTGLQRYTFGGENVRFINALAFLSGNMGRSGGGSYYHTQSFAHFNLEWTRVTNIPSPRTLSLPLIGEEILRADLPPIHMIWINGTNIVNQAPNIDKIIRALKTVPFKVVVDAFMTDTADQADLVLPSTLMLEQEDIVGSYWHDNLQWAEAVVPPPEGARDDYGIVADLGKRLNPPVLLPPADTVFRLSLDSSSLETSLEALKVRGWTPAHGPRVPYKGLVFDHPDERYHPPLALHDEPAPPLGYPLRLLTLIRRGFIHSQILPEEQKSPSTVWVAPETMKSYLNNSAEEAILSSPIGRMKVSVRALEGLHPETVVYRRGDWKKHGGGANQLIEDRTTDMGTGASFYDQYVTLKNRGRC